MNKLAFLSSLSMLLIASTVFGQAINFEDQIAPILESRCWDCHNEDAQESGLRLDTRAYMLKGGDSGLPAIVPNQPDKSYLMTAIHHLDEDVLMPPDDDQLPQEDIKLFEQWIQEGAVWPGQMNETMEIKNDHWSFQPVVRPSVPESDHNSLAPVDQFLLAKLSEKGLTFSESAPPGTLIRRASIVLTGLAPTPEEVEQFVSDYKAQPDQAYEALVNRLIASPHFGERWAEHWLHVIRWAETNGSEANLYRKNAWVYRDYVVRSFNEDKPYDQFVREQISGDTLGSGEATGFLVAGPHVPAATVGREPSAIRQARADRMDEIMQTVGASVMGVTIGCARCHNHKFDPISIQDYYAMTAVFQDVEFGSRRPEYSENHPLRQRGKKLWEDIAKQRNLLRKSGGWEENWGAFRELHFPKITTSAVRIRFKSNQVSLDELEVLGPDDNQNLASKRLGTKLTGYPEKGNENRNPIKYIYDGDYGTMAWRAKTPKDSDKKPWVQFEFSQPQEVSRLRLSNNREYFYDTDYLESKPWLPNYQFDMDIRKDDGSWQPWVGTWYVNKKLNEKHPERKKSTEQIQRLISQLAEQGPRPSFVGRFIPPETTYVLHRGSPENPRDEIGPAGPRILEGDLALAPNVRGPLRRNAFADWMTRSENPLTSRVMVNRIWHHVFGSGIVTTTSDFGKAGAPPTHPELLEWLSAEFVAPTSDDKAPWSVKRMIKMLVMSQAFRQANAPKENASKLDANTSLLWRFPPRRVEAEVIRDSILIASDSLDPKIGGRSYRIHNEKKTYAQWEVVDNHGPKTWRRMLYQERMRRVDDRMFTAFDFPDCGQVRAKRPVSTTPLQALNLMNSAFVMGQAERIANKATRDSGGDDRVAVQRCFELLLGRLPEQDELDPCIATAKEVGLSQVCRALINSNEFAFLP